MPECSQDILNPAEVENLFPENSAPENRYFDPTECVPDGSSLLSVTYTPLLLTGLLRQVLLQYFADAENIENPRLRAYLTKFGAWSADPAQSGIVIESSENWRPEVSGKKPAIIIKDKDWVAEQQGIDNFTGDDWRSGEQEFVCLWRGQHMIHVVSKEGAEAKIIAAEIANFLTHFTRPIRRELGFQDFHVTKISELYKIKEMKEALMVSVVIDYSVLDTWTLTEEAPRLKRISFSLDTEEIFK